MTPRGIRNINPGNLRLSKKPWVGEVRPSRDEAFCTFSEPLYGLRAMMRLLVNYNQRHGIKTLKQALNRYAPKNENDTKAYVENVASWADIRPNKEWDFTDPIFLVPVCKAMVRMENGSPTRQQVEEGATPLQWYSNKTYWDAYELAIKGKITGHSMNRILPAEPEEVTEAKEKKPRK